MCVLFLYFVFYATPTLQQQEKKKLLRSLKADLQSLSCALSGTLLRPTECLQATGTSCIHRGWGFWDYPSNLPPGMAFHCSLAACPSLQLVGRGWRWERVLLPFITAGEQPSSKSSPRISAVSPATL